MPEKGKDFMISHMSSVFLANKKEDRWNELSDKEKNYAYYLSEAGMSGARMLPH